LILDTGETLAVFLALGLEHAARLATDEQCIIHRPDIGGVLANSNVEEKLAANHGFPRENWGQTTVFPEGET